MRMVQMLSNAPISTKGLSRSWAKGVCEADTTRNAPCRGARGTMDLARVITSEGSKPPLTGMLGEKSKCAGSVASTGMPRQYVILLDAEVIGCQKRSRLDGALEIPTRPSPNPANNANANATLIETQR